MSYIVKFKSIFIVFLLAGIVHSTGCSSADGGAMSVVTGVTVQVWVLTDSIRGEYSAFSEINGGLS